MALFARVWKSGGEDWTLKASMWSKEFQIRPPYSIEIYRKGTPGRYMALDSSQRTFRGGLPRDKDPVFGLSKAASL